MIVEKRISFVRLVRLIWKELLGILVASALPVATLIYFEESHHAINASIPLIIGTAIAIFLGFRTNSAYDRWWEARKIWGGILVDGRNLIRLADHMTAHDNHEARQVVDQMRNRQIAWTHLLCDSLKGRPLGVTWLDQSDALRPGQSPIASARDPVLAVLNLQSESVVRLAVIADLHPSESVLMHEILNRLNDYYGACMRIKTTVFPVHYQFFTRVFIWIFVVLLGFSLPAHENANYSLIPAIFLIGWVFFMVEGIGKYMQDPFADNRNVIPMDSLARTLEINLLEQSGQSDLPPPIEPVDGALS